MDYNLIHSIENISDESGSVTEPVTLSEMKDYMRLTGIDESGSFDFDDTLIDELISSARQRLEAYTGCILVPKTIDVYLTNLSGNISLPGPVTGDITALDCDGVDISDDVKLTGSKFPDLREPLLENMKLSYNAGYEVLPKGLKNAIMAEVLYRYENRGDEGSVCKSAMILANPYVKQSSWA